MTEQTPLPDWIKWSKSKGYYVIIDPLVCKRCNDNPWYPRINSNGNLKLNMCPHCKSALWNVPKGSG